MANTVPEVLNEGSVLFLFGPTQTDQTDLLINWFWEKKKLTSAFNLCECVCVCGCVLMECAVECKTKTKSHNILHLSQLKLIMIRFCVKQG